MALEPPKPTPPSDDTFELIDLGPEDGLPLPVTFTGRVSQAQQPPVQQPFAQPPPAQQPAATPANLSDGATMAQLLGLAPRYPEQPEQPEQATESISHSDVSTEIDPNGRLMLETADATRVSPPATGSVAPAQSTAPMDLGFRETTPVHSDVQRIAAQSRQAELPAEPTAAPARLEAKAPPAASTLRTGSASSPSQSPASSAKSPTRSRRAAGFGLVICLGATALYGWWQAHHARQTPTPLPHAVTQQAPPRHLVAPQPAPMLLKNSPPPTTAAVALPTPVLTPLTVDTVDSLDYASLRAGVDQLAHQLSPATVALRHWAQFRLTEAFGEPLPAAPAGQLKVLGRGAATPLAQVAHIAAQVRAARPEASLLALRSLRGAAARLPQGKWLTLWATDRARGLGFKPLPANVHSLEQLLKAHPRMADAQVLRAKWTRVVEPEGLQQVALWSKAAQQSGDADLHARLLELLVESEAWSQLDLALGSPSDDNTTASLAALVRAAPQHQDLLWRLRVHRHVRMGDFEAAMALANQRAAAEPKHAEAQKEQERLAQVVAQVQHRQVPAPPVPGPEAEMLQASRQLFEAIAQGDHGAAEAPVKQMLGLSAQLPAPWHKLAEAERRGDWREAGHTLDGLLWRDPTVGDPVDEMLQLIELTHRGGDVTRATAEAEALVSHLPHDDRPPTLLAELAHADHHDDIQVRWRTKLLERHPHDRAHTLALAMALTDAGRTADALSTLTALLTLDPEARGAEFLYVQGRALRLENPVAAHNVLMASAKAQPQVKTYTLLADLAQERGKLDEAADAMRQAMLLAPESRALKLRLVRLLLLRGGLQEAVDILQQILDADPKAGDAAEMLADVLHEQGDLAKAQAMYSRALTDAGPHAPLLLKLALMQLHELHDPNTAEKTLSQAIAADPALPEPHYYLGLTLHDRGADRDAKKQLQAYLQLDPQGRFAADCKDALNGL